MKTEFKPGDEVTYKPYEKALKAVVKLIHHGSPFRFHEDDDRIFYTLTGRSYDVKTPWGTRRRHDPVQAITTGLSIVESVFFQEHDKNGALL